MRATNKRRAGEANYAVKNTGPGKGLLVALFVLLFTAIMALLYVATAAIQATAE